MIINRRQFLALLGIGASTGGYSFLVEPNWLRLKEYTIKSPKWRGDKLRIAFATDFHAGCPSVGIEEIDHIVEKLNALEADIVFLGGDFLIQGILFGHYVPPQPIADALGKLKSRLGTYTVLGNHDWWGDARGLWKALEENGIKVLENSAVAIHDGERPFWVTGMADDMTRDPDYTKTIEAVTDNAPVIMLAHDPACFLDIKERPVMTLCGHTHGGQVTIPYITPIIIPGRAPLKYAYGHIQEGGRDMIVSCGIGTSGLPIRFGRRPEIVSITLEAV